MTAVRVLVVTNMYPTEARPGGGTFVADQVRSLRATGAEAEVLFVDRATGGRRVYRGLAERVRADVARSSPDLVHVMYGGVMADVVTRVVEDRPVLVTFHGDDLQGNAGNGLLGALSGWYSTVASARAARRAAGVVVVSPHLRDAIAKSVNGSRLWVVSNGVDLGRFRPRDRAECQRALGWDTGRAQVLFPAPPARGEKRFHLAAAAVAMLRQSGVAVDLQVLDGVPHEEVPTWLNAADVVLLTSLREGSPMVVKEALACNVAVVSVDVGDVRERLAGIEGCSVAEPTPEDLSHNLGRALARTERIEGRERVAELSLERVADTLREIYGVLTGAR
jgi:teichuronic acid biosynthesis glycosyltransferase TuaC